MKWALAAAAASVLALALWPDSNEKPQARLAPPAVHAPQASSAAGRSWFSNIPGAGPGAAAPVPLAQQVDVLVATGKPEDLYTAHNLIQTCMAFRQNGTIPFYEFPVSRDMTEAEKQATAAMCASLTERMQRSRLDYLAIAAKAGVMGAPSAFLAQGPFGDPSALQTRPDDPLVVQWKQQALEQLRAQAVQGDLTSLTTLWTEHMGNGGVIPSDPVLAYTYLGALQRILSQVNPDEHNPYATDDFPFLAAALTPAQRAGADAEAGRIAEAARVRREAGQAGANAPASH